MTCIGIFHALTVANRQSLVIWLALPPHKKFSSRWDRRTLPPEPCHRCKPLLLPLHSISP